jgi:hypothetical protein
MKEVTMSDCQECLSRVTWILNKEYHDKRRTSLTNEDEDLVLEESV